MATVVATSLPVSAGTDLAQRELEKESKVQQLRERLEADEAGPRAAAQLVQGGELESHGEMTSDGFLERWLRARAWDVERAFNSIVSHAEWRAANMPNGHVDTASIATELACEKVYIQGCDRKGRPIMILQLRKHNGWTRCLEELERLCCYVLDECVARAKAHAKTNPHGQCLAVLDLTDMGAISMDMQAIRTLLVLLGEHYVERLGAMIFYNPPYIFSSAFSTLSPLLPEPTRQKIKVLDAAQGSAELLGLVDPQVLPTEYGGEAALAAPLGKQ